ncbi:ankyrin repeat domain-containing protein [Helicobacter himalayensis]|uniref:ankyrin repeat domain-containing protein n=1 Tax=Helicobacter himalayensis TaxID=1591088 RepID=UPI00082B9373|nr:ankyrin repeat domain-containing protein [Helicobacter himalayensis]
MRWILTIVFLCVSASFGANDRYNNMLFSNNYTEVRKGISLGADVEARLRGSTPLYDAARKGNLEIVGLLIERGADVNAICHGESALLKVVALGNVKMAKELIRKGADVNIHDEHLGNTPLHYAVAKKNTPMIELLLANGADMYAENNRGDTPAGVVLAKKSMPAVSIENDDVVLKASSFNLAKGSVGINITNKTDQFITITYLALYIDGDLISEASANKKLAPKAGGLAGNLSIPKETYEGAKIKKSGAANVKYGFAVEYNIDGATRSLYKSTKAEFQLW